MTDASRPEGELNVEHDVARREFRITLGGDTALLTYELSPGIMDITHTEVPPAFRGRGIAGQMVRTALESARARQLKVIPSCPYVADYIRRNPEFKALLRGR